MKKLKRFFNLRIFPTKAKFEDSGIGPVLSPYMQRDKILSLCNFINDLTKSMTDTLYVSVNVIFFIDNTFQCFIKGPKFKHLCDIIFTGSDVLDFNDLYLLAYYKYRMFYSNLSSTNNFYL